MPLFSRSAALRAPLRQRGNIFFDADPGLTPWGTYIPLLRDYTYGLSPGRKHRPQDSIQGKTLAEVNSTYFGVVAELPGRASREDAAINNGVMASGAGKCSA